MGLVVESREPWDAVASLVLCKCEQDRTAGLADHGVGLPVADTGAFLNEPRPLVDRDPVPDLPPVVMTPVAFPAQLPATQVNMELATTALVRMDMLVDPFEADLQPCSCDSQPLICSRLQSLHSRFSTASQVLGAILGLARASRRAGLDAAPASGGSREDHGYDEHLG